MTSWRQGGQTTREYVALVFPSDKTRWNVSQPVRIEPGPNSSPVHVPPQTEMDAPDRREVIEGLRPGEYLAIAVDNIEYDDARDAAILEKLAAGATKVTLGDGASIEVPLRRLKLSDIIR